MVSLLVQDKRAAGPEVPIFAWAAVERPKEKGRRIAPPALVFQHGIQKASPSDPSGSYLPNSLFQRRGWRFFHVSR